MISGLQEQRLRRAASYAGTLFLVQIVAASVSHSALVAPLLKGTDYLNALPEHAARLVFGALLDLITGLAVFGIGVLLYPVLKKYSQSIALWYAGLRLYEFVCAMIGGILLLTVLRIARDCAAADITEKVLLGDIARYLLKARDFSRILMLWGFAFNSFFFYWLLLRSRLLPRFISIWGLIGLVLIFTEVTANLFGASIGGIIVMVPMGLNEIFLGFWLIFRGFSTDTSDTN